MLNDILGKLRKHLFDGLNTESDVVYFLVQVRKLLELTPNDYEYLKFHCDWALHTVLSGTMAQTFLAEFDSANLHLRGGGVELHDLPPELQRRIDDISTLHSFKIELYRFLGVQSLPSINEAWPKFLVLYGRIVKDCPLVMRAANATASIEKVNLAVEEPEHQPVAGQHMHKISWTIHDKNGQTGEIFVINSFMTNKKAR